MILIALVGQTLSHAIQKSRMNQIVKKGKKTKNGKWMEFYWTEIVPVIHPGVTIGSPFPAKFGFQYPKSMISN